MLSIEEGQEPEEEAEESRVPKETLSCTGNLCRGEAGMEPGGSEARWAENLECQSKVLGFYSVSKGKPWKAGHDLGEMGVG